MIGLIAISGMILFACQKNSSYTPPAMQPPTGDTSNTGTATTSITMYNMAFSPSTVTVKKGAVVKWTNDDGYAHTVNSNDGTTFSSGNIAGGGTFTYTATTPGTFNYHCLIHGLPMSGVLIVNP